MKVYDKEIYNKQENIKVYILIIAVFLLGFFAGYIASSFGNSGQVENKENIKIENKIEL